MELSGKIIQMLPIESGDSQRGSWQKRTMVIRNDSDKYPKPVAILLWGDMVDTALSVGDEVTVHINIESREYRDRWFTDVKAWKIDRKEGGAVSKPEPVEPVEFLDESTNPLPF
jgi:hypothetical protein